MKLYVRSVQYGVSLVLVVLCVIVVGWSCVLF